MTLVGSTTERRITRRGRETRERILSAAAALIYEHGVAETTLEDIRAAAGVSGSQVYHYFDSKEDLVRAVIVHQSDAVLAVQEPAISHIDSVAGLRKWRNSLVRYQKMSTNCSGGCPIGSIGSELAEVDELARLNVAMGFSRWELKIREGIRAMHEKGDLPKDANPDDLALGILAALQGGLLLTQIRREVRPLEVALDTVIDAIEALSMTVSTRNRKLKS